MEVADRYVACADRRGRVHLHRAEHEYYKVTEYDNGTILLEPWPMISPETQETIQRAMENYDKGIVSEPLDLSRYKH